MSSKNRKIKEKKKEEFTTTPFKALKGVVVENGKKAPSSQKDVGKEQRKEDRKTSVEDDGPDLFARQMEQLGVKAIEDEDNRLVDPVPEDVSLPSAEENPEMPRTEEELFLQSLGEMDVCFREEFPPEEEPPFTSQPRRMKQVRRGTLWPEARLDLHGLSRQQAVEKVAFFLQDSLHQGLQTVLLITGRGYGSEDGPVLRPAIEKYLDSAGRSWVGEWGRAPKKYGGEGALVVFLKSPGKNPRA